MKEVVVVVQDDPLLNSAEAAEYVGLTNTNLRQLRFRGEGPDYYKPTERVVLYRKSDLDKWLESTKHSTSAPVKEKVAAATATTTK